MQRRRYPNPSIAPLINYIVKCFYIGTFIGYLEKFRLFGLGLRTSVKSLPNFVERLRIKTGRYRFLTYFNKNTTRVTIRCVRTRVYIRADAPDLVGTVFKSVALLVYKSIIYQFKDVILRKITRVTGLSKALSSSGSKFRKTL